MIEASTTLDGMTNAEARMAIAADVLAHLDAKKLLALQGAYCLIREREAVPPKVSPDNRNLKHLLQTLSPRCDVCAKGALFIAHVLRFNGVLVPEDETLLEEAFCDNVSVTSPLTYFDPYQLDLIECAFEDDDMQDTLSDDDEQAARGFHKANHDRTSVGLLRAIMQNIIDNKGTFIP